MLLGVPARRDPAGLHTGEDQTRPRPTCGVPADQQARPPAGDGEHRRLDRQRTAAGGEERVVGADRVGHQFLGPLQVPVARRSGRPARRGQNIRPEGLCARAPPAPAVVHAAALPVARRGEAVPAQLVVVSQRLDQRCLIVVHADCLPTGGPIQHSVPPARITHAHHRSAVRGTLGALCLRGADVGAAIAVGLLEGPTPQLMAPARLHRRGGSSRQSSWLPGTGPGAGQEPTSSTS